MGSELNPTKKWFDPSMSRRTRKPLNNFFKETHQDVSSIPSSPPKEPPHQLNQQQQEDQEQEQERERDQEQEPEIDHKSLNQLMRGEEESLGEGGGSLHIKSSLGEHFSEEEKQMQMQIVRKINDKQGGENGVKFRGIMNRYVKVLSGLIKAKHDGRRLSGSKKKPIFRLKI